MAHREITAIQYLRGLAACAVVVDHTNAMMSFPKYFGSNCGEFWNSGALGVNLFFIISGFIIALTSLTVRDNSINPKVSIKMFALKRFTRIVPIMWIAIATYYLGREIGRNGGFDFSYVRAFFLVPFGTVEPNNIWTLRHEAIFYALFAVSFLGIRARGGLMVIWAMSPIVYAALALPTDPASTGMQFVRLITHPCNLEFTCGLLIGLAWHYGSRLRSISVPIPSGALMLALFALFCVICHNLGASVDTLFSCAISSLLGGAIILLAAHLRCTDGAMERILLYLGEASFSIYLFHLHIASACLGLWAHHFKATPLPAVLIGTTLVAALGSIAIYELIEKPVHRLTLKYLSGGLRLRAA